MRPILNVAYQTPFVYDPSATSEPLVVVKVGDSAPIQSGDSGDDPSHESCPDLKSLELPQEAIQLILNHRSLSST